MKKKSTTTTLLLPDWNTSLNTVDWTMLKKGNWENKARYGLAENHVKETTKIIISNQLTDFHMADLQMYRHRYLVCLCLWPSSQTHRYSISQLNPFNHTFSIPLLCTLSDTRVPHFPTQSLNPLFTLFLFSAPSQTHRFLIFVPNPFTHSVFIHLLWTLPNHTQ